MIKIRNCNIVQFVKIIQKKGFYCFGQGIQAKNFFEKYQSLDLERCLNGFVDNNPNKMGMTVNVNGMQKKIYSFEQFLAVRDTESIVLTTSMYYHSMIEQMDKEPRLDGLECYIDTLVEENYEPQHYICEKTGTAIIPKTIHYCWFGGAPVPPDFLEYMKSWKKYCPDYEIVRWDETNYDITRSAYMKQAYDAKKWAFVSDYARLDIIYEYGGIYLDTDVELVKNLDDLLENELYCGFEQNHYINFGLGYGAVKGHPILQGLLSRYQGMQFMNQDGSYNLKSCAVYQLQEMMKFGFAVRNTYQNRNHVSVYPSECFAPINLRGTKSFITPNTYSIHHYSSTWWDKEVQENMERQKRYLMYYEKRAKEGEAHEK